MEKLTSDYMADYDEAVDKLKELEKVHSIILFGSRAKGKIHEDSDIDICIVEKPRTELSLEDKIKINTTVPERFDVSFFHDLPMNLRSRVFKEGEILYTEDELYVYRLIKETSFELPRYRKMQGEYHRKTMERVREKIRGD